VNRAARDRRVAAVGFLCALSAPTPASSASSLFAFLFARLHHFLYQCSSAFICGAFELRTHTTIPRLFHNERQKVIQSGRLPIQSRRQRQSISPRRRSSIRPRRQTIASRRSQRHQQQSRKRQSHPPLPPERPHRTAKNHRHQ